MNRKIDMYSTNMRKCRVEYHYLASTNRFATCREAQAYAEATWPDQPRIRCFFDKDA